jgi:hypothetical protein
MVIESNTERPASLEDVQRIVSLWIKTLPAHDSARIRLSRVSGTPKRLLISTAVHKNLKFEVTQSKVSLEAKSRRISLEVSDFVLTTEVDGATFLVIFELKTSPRLSPLTRVIDSLSRTEHPVFFSRAFNALSSITNELSSQSVEELTASSTDFELLVNAVSATSTAAASTDADPLIRAKLRGIEHRKRILEKPPSGRSAAKPEPADRPDSGEKRLCVSSFSIRGRKDSRWPQRSSGCAQWARSMDAVDFLC